MVVIRLARGGAKKSPFYRIVLADVRCKRDGRFIEQLGFFNPMARGGEIPLNIDLERIQYWLAQGAKCTERVQKLVKDFKKHSQQESAAAAA